MFLAEALDHIASKFDVDFYFKASWDKANRTKAGARTTGRFAHPGEGEVRNRRKNSN